MCIENGCSITVTSKQTLKIRNYMTNKSKYFFPKEIEYLILENSKIYLSVEVLRLLVKNKVAVLICDDKHSPLIEISDSLFNQNAFSSITNKHGKAVKRKNLEKNN